MPAQPSQSIADRFREWYEYERDCNAKALAMLQSVPTENRSSPDFGRAAGKLAHLVAARHFWLFRLQECSDRPASWFPATSLEELPGAMAEIENRWMAYLATLADAELVADCLLVSEDGRRWRWPLINLLTQLFGHAWYHRGQIAMLVHDLGGKQVNTDFIFWTRPTAVDERC